MSTIQSFFNNYKYLESLDAIEINSLGSNNTHPFIKKLLRAKEAIENVDLSLFFEHEQKEIKKIRTMLAQIQAGTLKQVDELPSLERLIAEIERIHERTPRISTGGLVCQRTVNQEDVSRIADALRKNTMTPLKNEVVEAFLTAGGEIETGQAKYILSRSCLYDTVCSSGMHRSQVAAVLLKRNDCKVENVIAAGQSGASLNPRQCMAFLLEFDDRDNFTKAFGMTRHAQLGQNIPAIREKHVGKQGVEANDLEVVRELYRDYFQHQATPRCYFCFAEGGAVLVNQLVQRKGSLEGFKIVFLDWQDTVSHRSAGDPIAVDSPAAFQELYDKLKTVIEFKN